MVTLYSIIDYKEKSQWVIYFNKHQWDADILKGGLLCVNEKNVRMNYVLFRKR